MRAFRIAHYLPQVVLATALLLGDSLLAQTRLTKKPRPNWIDKPPSGYYVGISTPRPSEAEAREEAVQSARRQIIESLGIIIESQWLDSILERGGSISSQDAFTRSTVKVVAKNIIAVVPDRFFVEQYKKGAGRKTVITYQAFAGVHFDETAYRATMAELVNEIVSLAHTGIETVRTQALQGQLPSALASIQSIHQNLQKYLEITGLTPTETGQLQQLAQEVRNLATNLKNSIRLTPSNDIPPAKWGAPLAKPLGVRLIYSLDNQTLPLSNITVVFKCLAGQALFNEQSRTDAQGWAYCQVQEVQRPAKLVFQVEAQLPAEWEVPNPSQVISINNENKVIVHLVETNLGKPVVPPQAEPTLCSKLTAAGLQIIEKNPFNNLTAAQLEKLMDPYRLAKQSGADLLIIGTLVAEQPNRVQNNFYFTRVRGTIQVYNVARQVVVGTYYKEDKDAGNSAENAGSKALKKVYLQLEKELATALQLE